MNANISTINYSNWSCEKGVFCISAPRRKVLNELSLKCLYLRNTPLLIEHEDLFSTASVPYFEDIEIDYCLLHHLKNAKLNSLKIENEYSCMKQEKILYEILVSNNTVLNKIRIKNMSIALILRALGSGSNSCTPMVEKQDIKENTSVYESCNPYMSYMSVIEDPSVVKEEFVEKKIVIENLIMKNIDKEAFTQVVETGNSSFNTVYTDTHTIPFGDNKNIKEIKAYSELKQKVEKEVSYINYKKDQNPISLEMGVFCFNILKQIQLKEELEVEENEENEEKEGKEGKVIMKDSPLKYSFIAQPNQEIPGQTNCLYLSSNYFNIQQLTSLIISENQLLALELDTLYIKDFLDHLLSIPSTTLCLRLQCFIIRNTEFNSPEIIKLKHLFEILQPSLSELHLVNTYIDSRESSTLFEYLKILTNLKTLNLSENYFESKFTSNLIDFLDHNKGISSLYLRNTSLSASDCGSLMESLRGRNTELLDLSGMKGKSSMEVISRGSVNLDNSEMELVGLRIDYSVQGDEICLVRNKYLVSLELAFVDLDLIKHKLYYMLRNYSYLEHLSVRHCYKENMLVKLISQLHKVCLFKSLDIGGSLVNSSSAKYIKNILNHQVNCVSSGREDESIVLTSLYLKGCQIEDETMNSIIEPIVKSGLLILDIRNNMMSMHSLIRFIKEISSNPKLTRKLLIKANKSFSAETNSNNQVLQKIFEYENSLIKDSLIIEHLKAVEFSNKSKALTSKDTLSSKSQHTSSFDYFIEEDFLVLSNRNKLGDMNIIEGRSLLLSLPLA